MDKFEKIDETHALYNEFLLYFKTYFDNPEGAKRFSTEETQKGNRLEIIQSFDEKRNPKDEMGSAREVVYKMLKYFASERIVDVARGGVTILDKERLRRLAL